MSPKMTRMCLEISNSAGYIGEIGEEISIDDPNRDREGYTVKFLGRIVEKREDCVILDGVATRNFPKWWKEKNNG